VQNQLDIAGQWPQDWAFARPQWFSYVTLKRLLDVVFTLIGLIVLLPLLLVIAVAIKMDSPGPVLFVQERVGLNGRRFACFKFRSMRQDPVAEVEELSRRGDSGQMLFKIPNNPRITAVGGFLRRTSLDELPQLWNVLKGDMSLVGPRPLVPAQVEQFPAHHLVRHAAKPGLTCLWVIRGRSDCDFEQWMAYDQEYLSRRSLLLDAQIIIQTLFVVVAGRGAY
jgi:lipopolysaccharide/colanic/teichoic acid biosynthesis glycosyltransferase